MNEKNFSPITDEMAELINAGQKLEAIKLYRETYGADLLNAKEAVESYGSGLTDPRTERNVSFDKSSASTAKERSFPSILLYLGAIVLVVLVTVAIALSSNDSKRGTSEVPASVQETAAKETKAPETKAPETKAPETQSQIKNFTINTLPKTGISIDKAIEFFGIPDSKWDSTSSLIYLEDRISFYGHSTIRFLYQYRQRDGCLIMMIFNDFEELFDVINQIKPDSIDSIKMYVDKDGYDVYSYDVGNKNVAFKSSTAYKSYACEITYLS